MSRSLFGVLLVACTFALMSRRAECADPAPQTSYIEIHGNKTREPLSKYVYGQFIEHLGRCIYGGIWAEMLEDRKFFYPVGAKTVAVEGVSGQPSQVTMDRDKPFVGDHTPKITLPGDGQAAGIVQAHLALVKGKQYVGRIWLAGDAKAAPVKVSLVWGDGQDQRQTIAVDAIAADYAKTPLQFTAGGDTDAGRLEITSVGSGSFHVGTVSLMPADNVQGMRADTLELLKDSTRRSIAGPAATSSAATTGGTASATATAARRGRTRPGRASSTTTSGWTSSCSSAGCWPEPYIAVNSGLGDAEAAEEVEYANGQADRPGASCGQRTAIPSPTACAGGASATRCTATGSSATWVWTSTSGRHNEFAEAMRAADPSIKLVAVGAVGPWSEGMLRNCADHMDLISEHFYCGENRAQPGRPRPADPRQHPPHRRGPSRLPQAARFAQGQGHPHRDGRVELLVRRRNCTASSAPAISLEGRPGHRRRPARIRPAKRHRLSWPTTPRRST